MDIKKINVRLKSYANSVADLVCQKNADYDKAFEKSFRKFGWATYFIRIGDKLNRLEALTLNNQVNTVKDENIEDTLTDIIGYSLLLLEILKRKGEENDND